MQPSLTERIRVAVRDKAAERAATQQDIADLLGLHKSQITRRFNGEVDWPTAELEKLAAMWKLPIGALIPDDGEAA